MRLSNWELREQEHYTTLVLIALSLLIGVVTVIGGSIRWSAQAYQSALQVPGAPESWGIALFIAAVMAGFGYISSGRDGALATTLFVVGMFLMGLWYLFFGIAFVIQAITTEVVSYNGTILNFALALMYVIRAVMYWSGNND